MELPEGMRAALREPLGELIPEEGVRAGRVLEMASRPVVTVGDRTTERFLGWGARVDLQIVDGLERRAGRAAPPLPEGASEVRCSNPPGSISEEAARAVQAALRGRSPVRITVDGEEDLLALPACACAPDGASVFYGQPLEGMVAVRVGPEVRRKTQKIMDAMRAGNDEKVAV